MKKAILYIRVSTDEQAEKGYSLAHQEERLRKYCEINDIEVVGFYKEDHSAKSFERPQFKKLLDVIKKNKNVANYLLFTKWDRFSRNAGDAYGMISILNKYGVEPQSIEQQLDFNVPENKLMLAFYLAAPEVENDRRALNVIVGMRKAKRDGRYLGLAPKGYINTRNANGMPIISVDSEQAAHIKWCYEEIAKGKDTVIDIWRQAVEKGFKCSRGHFWTVIRNPVYYGLIQIASWKDEESSEAKGIHTPILTKELFDDVQDVLNGKKKNSPAKHTKKDEFPLRGFLTCKQCNNPLTASASKGRSSKYYYYHCQHGCPERIKAEVVNNQLVVILENLAKQNYRIKLFKDVTKSMFKENESTKKEGSQKFKLEIEKIEGRLQNAQQMLLDGEITSGDYKEMKARYEPELAKLKRNKEESKSLDIEFENYVKYCTEIVESLDKLYLQGDIHTKQQLLGSIFSEKLIFENNQYRTVPLNPVVALMCNTSADLQGIKKDKPSKNDGLSCQVGRTGFEPATPWSQTKYSTELNYLPR
jgi:site-specific DNA recombinase